MDKYTKVKEINKNGCYYTKKKHKYFLMMAVQIMN